MDNLEYELSGQQISKPRDQEFIIEIKEEEARGDAAIQFSVDIIKTLEERVKLHNENNLKKVTLHQLKTVFCNAVEEYCFNEDYNNISWAFARVNLYLRMARGENSNTVKSINTTKSSHLIEIAARWIPTLEDFEDAEKLINEKRLDYKFKSIDELYINFQPIQAEID